MWSLNDIFGFLSSGKGRKVRYRGHRLGGAEGIFRGIYGSPLRDCIERVL